ncbi:hypothetical protein [Pararhodobacter sp. SW119]|uniref:hypothetical protein n=1 Tax=Pararhodobacter sp. SW119 TaxID=2780075 RepID=UPI001ADFFFD9|nr:hypothetical protein [Pararhodobacter sp. SW119]
MKNATVDEKFALLDCLRTEGISGARRSSNLHCRRGARLRLRRMKFGQTLIPTFPWKITEHGRLIPEATERIRDIMRRRELLPRREFLSRRGDHGKARPRLQE